MSSGSLSRLSWNKNKIYQTFLKTLTENNPTRLVAMYFTLHILNSRSPLEKGKWLGSAFLLCSRSNFPYLDLVPSKIKILWFGGNTYLNVTNLAGFTSFNINHVLRAYLIDSTQVLLKFPVRWFVAHFKELFWRVIFLSLLK